MARPRKSAELIDARQRMQNAFWQLLEENQLREITVGTITAQAECNRGTFYYHFRDLDDLMLNAIEKQVVGNGAIAEGIFNLTTGTSYEEFLNTYHEEIRHMSLILNRGGMDMVFTKVCTVVKKLWQSVLCPDGSDLTSEAIAIIEFTVGGTLSLMVANSSIYETHEIDPGVSCFIQENARITIERLARTQDLSAKEVLMRLTAANRFLNASRATI